MAKISTYLDTRRLSKTGLYSLKIIVRSKQSVGYIQTGIQIKKENWINNTIVGTPKDKQLNKLLGTNVATLKIRLLSLSMTKNTNEMSAKEIIEAISPETISEEAKQQSNKKTILEYWEYFVNNKSKERTKEVYNYTLSSLKKYCDIEKLLFSDITYSWLRDWEKWLKNRGNAVNTISIHFRNLRAVYNEAIKENVITQEGYPFRQFRIKTEETIKRSLTVEELRTLRDYDCEQHIRKYIDVFFISFYLCGINMVDLLHLPKPTNNRIEYRRSKTDILCQLEIPKEALDLIKKYEGERLMLSFGEQYRNHKDFLHRMNENLQKVGTMHYISVKTKNGASHRAKKYTPIFPHITSYWARHTWATIAAEIDIPDAVIDAALGHKSPYPMADIYIRRNAKKVDDAVRAVIDYVNSYEKK